MDCSTQLFIMPAISTSAKQYISSKIGSFYSLFSRICKEKSWNQYLVWWGIHKIFGQTIKQSSFLELLSIFPWIIVQKLSTLNTNVKNYLQCGTFFQNMVAEQKYKVYLFWKDNPANNSLLLWTSVMYVFTDNYWHTNM